jgi:pre-mRNA-splicing factor SYF2/beta-D-xylosidase 4
VLPFGFGLSYTTWVYTPLPDPAPPAAGAAAVRTVSLARVQAAAAAHAATGVIGHIPAGLKEVAAQFWVNVTNTGAVDSDDVVLGFLTPPGAGTNGVPLQELFGFERVFVPAGQTVTVYLGAQGVRFCQPDTAGVRHALKGQYKVTFGLKESAALGMGFAEFTVLAQ